MSRIRVNAVGEVGHRSQVLYVDDDGTETDISHCLTGVDVSIRVGDINRVTCHAFMDMGTFEGEIDHVIIDVIPPDRIPQVIEALKAKALSGTTGK